MIKNSIVLVPFPFDDLSNFKLRPALCLTSEIGNYNQIIIAFISSRIPETSIDSDIIIRINSEEFKGTGLTTDSVIRIHKIVTVSKSLIRRKLGKIDKSVEAEVKKKLKQLFDY